MNNKNLDLVQLDERILFDVAPFDAHAMDSADMAASVTVDADFDWTQATSGSESAFAEIDVADGANIDANQTENLDQLALLLDSEWSNENQLGPDKQLIVVDQGVEDVSSLLDLAIGQNDPGLFEILMIDSSESALDRINQRLSSASYSGLHFVAHGQDGELQLGNSTWNSTYLANHSQSFSGWKLALTPDADLFIYGCNVAETDFGQSFIQELANATGADVAASIDATGSNELGGDWDLEYRHGSFDLAAHPFDFHALDAWHYTLDIVTGNTVSTGSAYGESAHDSLAVSAKGDYVIVWTQDDGVDTNIYAQQFNADGSSKAAVFQVNDLDVGNQANASVAMDSHGNFVITWTDLPTNTIYAETFDADGTVDKSEFVVTNNADLAMVTMNNDGIWSVVWEERSSTSIKAQFFNADGSIRGSSFVVSSGGAANRQDLAADMNKYGELAVVWETETSSDDIFLNKFDIDGNSLTGEIKVADEFNRVNDPDVALNDWGEIVVSTSTNAALTTYTTVYWFNADGTLADSTNPMGIAAGDYHFNTSLDMPGNSKDFALAWHGTGTGDPNGVYYTIYDSSTDTFSSPTQVNSITTGFQGFASIHYGGPNEIMTTFSGSGSGGDSTVFAGDADFAVPHGVNDFVLDNNLVKEAEKGAIIGNLVGVDPGLVDPDTFTTDDSRFEIVNNRLKLVDDVELDFEVENLIDVEISVEDAKSPGTFIRTIYTIEVIDMDESATRVSLDNQSIDEDVTDGQLIANASMDNPDLGETYSYTLLNDAGGRFSIDPSGNLLIQDSSLINFEDQPSHRVKVQATDSGGGKFSREFVIVVNDVNEPTTWASLDSSDVNEETAGAVIGNLTIFDPDVGDTFTITTDDVRFEVVGGQLKLVDGVKLDHEVEDTVRVGVIVRDAAAHFFQRNFNITVNDIVEVVPIVSLDNSSVAEDAANNFVIGNADATGGGVGETFTYSLSNDADGRFGVTAAGDLFVKDSSKLDHETDDQHLISIQATGSMGASISNAYFVDVSDVNEAPTNLVLDNSAVDEDAANNFVVGSASVLDEDDGDTVTFTLENDSFGRFGITADGDLFIKDASKLDFESNESHRIEIKATDLLGLFLIEPVDITINDINEAPTNLSLDNASVDEDAANNFVIGSASSSDPDDGDSVTYTLLNDAGGRFGITAGGDLFVKDAGKLDHEVDEIHRIEIKATDIAGAFTTSQFDILVGDINEAPTDIAIDNSSVDEDAGNNYVIGSASVTDVDDGDTANYVLLNDADGLFGITAAGDLFVKDATKLDHEADATHRIEVQAVDSGGEVITKQFDISVDDINESPTNLTLDNTFVAEDAVNNLVIGSASSSDVDDSDTATYTLLNDADGRFGITSSGDLFVKDASKLNHEANDTHRIEIRVSDSGGLSTTNQFDISVTDVNETPTSLALDNSSVDEDAGNNFVIGSASSTDVDDGDTVAYTLLNDADGRFGITAAGDLFVKDASKLDHESNDTHRIEIRATDNGGKFVTKEFDISIGDINEAPTNLTLDNSSIDEDAANNFVIGTASILDADDGDSVTFTLDQDSFGRFGITSDGDLYVKDASKIDFEANDSHRIAIRGTDSAGNFVVTPIDISVNDINETPVTGDDFYGTDEETPLVIDPADLLSNDSDPENDSLSVLDLLDPPNGTLVKNGDGTYTYTPDENFTGVDQIKYQVSDSNGNTEFGTISVVVKPLNDDPVATNDRFGLLEGDIMTVSSSVFGNDSDIDGDLLRTGTVVSGPDHGTLVWNNDGTFTYRHDGSENHADQFQYQVFDGNGGSSIATVDLDITPVNDAPVAKGEKLETDSLTPLVITADDMLANEYDAEGDRLTLHIKRLPKHGTLEIVDGKLVYTPKPGFTGMDRIKYYVSDGTDTSDTVKLKIKVVAPPVPVDTPVDLEIPEKEETPVDESPSDDDESSPTDGGEKPGNEISSLPRTNGQPGIHVFEESEEFTGFNALQDDENSTYEFGSTQDEFGRSTVASNVKTVSYRSVDADSGLDFEKSDSGSLSVFETSNSDYEESIIFDNMSRELDSFNHDFKVDGAVDQVTYATLSSITGALTVGYVLWMVRGGMLMASFVSSLPAWQSVDPMNIVDFGTGADPNADDESLESMIQQFTTDV